MNIKKEIEQFSNETDKTILYWLFNKYHLPSEWQFVATSIHEKYGNLKHQYNRIWRPTIEGRLLYHSYNSPEIMNMISKVLSEEDLSLKKRNDN